MGAAIRGLLSRLLTLFRRKRSDAGLDEEIHAHLDRLAEDHRRRGMSWQNARAAARRDFGGVDQLKEQYRDQRTFPFVDTLTQDLRYALRTLRKSPGFVAAVVLSLAVGIGANSVVFTALNALMLTSLPVRSASELFHLTSQSTNAAAVAPARFSYQAFDEFRRAAPDPQALAAMSRVARMYRRVEGRRDPLPTGVQLVSGEYFSVLGVAAFRGRMLSRDDNQKLGAHPVAVMSHALWSQTFGSDPDIVGRVLTVNGHAMTIVGVAPAGFSGVWLESPVDLWIPLMMQHDLRYRQNFSASDSQMLEPWIPQDGIRWLDLIGRLPPGDDARTVAALKAAYERRLNERVSDPAVRQRLRQQGIVLQPFNQGFSNLRGNFAPPLYALFGMAAVILLIACANAANLLLARASARRREIAVRLSMGASRSRIVRQLLTESALLAAASCIAGLLVAGWAADLLVQRALGRGRSVCRGCQQPHRHFRRLRRASDGGADRLGSRAQKHRCHRRACDAADVGASRARAAAAAEDAGRRAGRAVAGSCGRGRIVRPDVAQLLARKPRILSGTHRNRAAQPRECRVSARANGRGVARPRRTPRVDSRRR